MSERLTAYVAGHPGWSGSSAANLFVDEALRMEDHTWIDEVETFEDQALRACERRQDLLAR